MTNNFFNERRPHNGLTYEAYLDIWEDFLTQTNHADLPSDEKNRYDYKKLNKQRSSRINKTYKVSEELKSLLTEIREPQIWMVLTEDWCGDSAQNLPYIAEMAKQNSNITLRILPRDANLDIMDQYLTDGKSRSIPKLVVFDENGDELFQWGPRPKEAQQFVKDELAKGREKPDVYQDLHLWYGRNRGKAIESEFIKMLQKVINNQPVQSR